MNQSQIEEKKIQDEKKKFMGRWLNQEEYAQFIDCCRIADRIKPKATILYKHLLKNFPVGFPRAVTRSLIEYENIKSFQELIEKILSNPNNEFEFIKKIPGIGKIGFGKIMACLKKSMLENSLQLNYKQEYKLMKLLIKDRIEDSYYHYNAIPIPILKWIHDFNCKYPNENAIEINDLLQFYEEIQK